MDFKELPQTYYEHYMGIGILKSIDETVSTHIKKLMNKNDISKISYFDNKSRINRIQKIIKEGDGSFDSNIKKIERLNSSELKKLANFIENFLPIGAKSSQKTESESNHNAILDYQAASIKINNEPLYYLTNNAVEAFISSDTDNILCRLKLPHRSFYLHLEKPLECNIGSMGVCFVCGMYVNESDFKTDVNSSKIFVTFILKQNDDPMTSSATFRIRNSEYGLTLETTSEDLEKSVVTGIKTEDNVQDVILNLLVASILYITGKNRDFLISKPIPTNRYIEDARNRVLKKTGIIKEVSRKTVIVIGHKFPKLGLTRQLGPNNTYILTHRYLVRGHFRLQPYGPRDNPTYEMIWIAPYIKGPEGTEFVPRKTIVKAVKE